MALASGVSPSLLKFQSCSLRPPAIRSSLACGSHYPSFSICKSARPTGKFSSLSSSYSISSSLLQPVLLQSRICAPLSPTLRESSSSTQCPFTVVAAKGYKMKTHKASAKRFRVTGNGKIMRRRAGKQHLLGKKNTKRKNRLSKMVQVNRSDYDNVIGCLPYLKVNRNAK